MNEIPSPPRTAVRVGLVLVHVVAAVLALWLLHPSRRATPRGDLTTNAPARTAPSNLPSFTP